jgi:hypothetical protein
MTVFISLDQWKQVVCEDFPELRFPEQVKHYNGEYVKEVETPCGHSDLAGTESIDQRWKRLDAHIPAELCTKRQREVSPDLWGYVCSWLWRHNLHGACLETSLGELVAATPVRD